METLVLGVCGVFIIGYIFLMTLLYVTIRREKQMANSIVQSKNANEFWTDFQRFIDYKCSRRIGLEEEEKPSAEYENASFFHQLYLPMQVEILNKTTAAYKRILKQIAIMVVVVLAIEVFLLIISQNSLMVYFILLILLALAAAIATFLWLPRLGRQRVEYLQDVDKKLMEISNGIEPPPYRVPLQVVLQRQESMAKGSRFL